MRRTVVLNAAERHDARYEPAFVSAFGGASAEERRRANVLWKQMRTVYADDVAAARAHQRFEREVWPLLYGMGMGATTYLSGLGTGQFAGAGYPAGGGLSATNQGLLSMANLYFYGWHEHVNVGTAKLVPLAEVIRPAWGTR